MNLHRTAINEGGRGRAERGPAALVLAVRALLGICAISVLQRGNRVAIRRGDRWASCGFFGVQTSFACLVQSVLPYWALIAATMPTNPQNKKPRQTLERRTGSAQRRSFAASLAKALSTCPVFCQASIGQSWANAFTLPLLIIINFREIKRAYLSTNIIFKNLSAETVRPESGVWNSRSAARRISICLSGSAIASRRISRPGCANGGEISQAIPPVMRFILLPATRLAACGISPCTPARTHKRPKLKWAAGGVISTGPAFLTRNRSMKPASSRLMNSSNGLGCPGDTGRHAPARRARSGAASGRFNALSASDSLGVTASILTNSSATRKRRASSARGAISHLTAKPSKACRGSSRWNGNGRLTAGSARKLTAARSSGQGTATRRFD